MIDGQWNYVPWWQHWGRFVVVQLVGFVNPKDVSVTSLIFWKVQKSKNLKLFVLMLSKPPKRSYNARKKESNTCFQKKLELRIQIASTS